MEDPNASLFKNLSTTDTYFQDRLEASKDNIHHPAHYEGGGIEPIQYIQSHGFNFALGNVIKYVTRAGKKPGSSRIEDLKKARKYLDFEIEFIETHDGIVGGKHEIH